MFFSQILLWGAMGLFLGVAHHFVMGFLSLGGGPTLAERLLEALMLAAWPLAVGAETGSMAQEGGHPHLGNIFEVKHLFSTAFSMVCLAFIALGGAMAVVQVFSWFFPDVIQPMSRSLMNPSSVAAGWSLLPLLFSGGTCLGLPYSFGPFVSVHEGKGFIEALERSRFLSRGLRTGLFFLQGFLFIVLCGGLFLLARIPHVPSLTNHVLEALVVAGVACLSGTMWNHAYRQAVTLDEKHVSPAPVRGGRIFIPDQEFSNGDPFQGSP